MQKSITALALAGVVGISSLFTGIAEAESVSSLKERQSQIQKERSEVNSNIQNADEQINSLKDQQADVKSELARLDLAINGTQGKIQDLTAKIEETKAEIARLQEEIRVTKERIDKRNELLKERARNYQVTGGMVSYIDVLMGSKNFSDFIDRASAVATIMQAVQDILRQHEADKKSLEENQIKVEQELASVEQMLASVEQLNQQLNAQRAEKDQLLATLEQQEEEIHEHRMELQEEEQLLAAQEVALQKAIQLEQERAAAAAAAAAAAKAAAASSASSSSSGSSGSSNSSGGAASTAPVTSGAFTMPANGRFTSGFGYRDGGMHYGVDIANRASGVPIWAVADGVVIQSYYSSSYGNVVFIAHSINGQTYTTIYAHMERRDIGTGATVSKGQQIGIMGNTGESYGQHLHFELHRGQWTSDKRNAIDPVGIVPMP